MRRPLRPTEHQEQVAVVQWMRKAHPAESQYLTAIPNGGLRAWKTAIRLKHEGVSPGYPDLLLDLPRGVFHGLRIEMKRKKGPRGGDAGTAISAEQAAWIERLIDAGYCCGVCYGADSAISVIEGYLKLSIPNTPV